MRKLSNRAMLLLSTFALILTLTGCQTSKPVIIPSDKAVIAMPHGKPFVPSVDGWFIPNARMYEILNSLDKTRISSE